MKKFVLLVLALIFVASSMSCISARIYQPFRELSGKQKVQAEQWLNNANLLYKTEDYNSAVVYYEKIIKYYPGTKYSEEAKDRLKEIKNTKHFKSD